MIQDIYPDILNNHYEHLRPCADDTVFVFDSKGKVLTFFDENKKEPVFPTWGQFSSDDEVVYLFSVNEKKFFLVLTPDTIPDHFNWYTLRELRALKPATNTGVFAAFTAYHLWQWYKTSRFCGACGHKTEFDSKERAMRCPECGNVIYPRINPAVIVGVINGNKLLLTKYNANFAFNALIAGFTEIGETAEETVKREVMEEVGLRVKNIRYYKSQPWGIAADLLMGFYCEVDGDDTIHRDDSELKYAAWVERDEIELQPDSASLTNEMMKMFKENKI